MNFRVSRGGTVRTLLVCGLALALGGSAAGLLTVLDQARSPISRSAELSYLPKGEYLKIAVLGYRQIFADLIWLKVVQHLGERNQTTAGYRWAYYAVDVLTDLDPKFIHAYKAAGVVLGVWGNLPHESVALLMKGMRHNPEVWEFPFYIGYDYFYELHDPASAAPYLRLASTLPGAPSYLPKLAARMTVESGDPDAALEFLERLYERTQEERLRESLALRIKEVLTERNIRFLEEGVRQYRTRLNRLPPSLEDLVRSHVIARIPEDPLGGKYRLNYEDGSVWSTALPNRLRVHRH